MMTDVGRGMAAARRTLELAAEAFAEIENTFEAGGILFLFLWPG